MELRGGFMMVLWRGIKTWYDTGCMIAVKERDAYFKHIMIFKGNKTT